MPHTGAMADLIECDEHRLHLIRSRPHYSRKTPRNDFQRDPFLLETNVPGIFVAGDVRHGSIKRVASAVGEGSIAIELIHHT